MNWLRLYQSLPYPLRVVAASHRGRRHSRWRYDDRTPLRVSEALERDRWSPEHWSAWQTERLRALLASAATRVPYYRDLWTGESSGSRRWSELSRWPILTKEALRENPAAFVVDGVSLRDLEELHTSGSTGTPLTLWRSRETSRAWYGIWEARCRAWNGLSRTDHWALLGGQLVTRVGQRRPPFWVWNRGLNQLYMSSYHLSPGNVKHYLDAIERHRVRYIVGYASSVYALAAEALSQGLATPELRLILSNAEPLYAHQRQTIAEAFRCPVRDTYGMTEIAVAGSECEHGRMHVWPDVGVIQVLRLDDDQPVEPGEVGRLVCTGLVNDVMPLIRYEVGDLGSVGSLDDVCACGRRLPVFTRLEGRSDDVIVTREGQRIGRLDPVFKSDLMLREAQIVQESIDELVVRLVVAKGFSSRHAQELLNRLRDRVGNMHVRLERVDSIPRAANGKFRAVVSKLSQRERSEAKALEVGGA
jgi:phenylacetate-coenzyme A ligase PaaK-like adenylate-forming protein